MAHLIGVEAHSASAQAERVNQALQFQVNVPGTLVTRRVVGPVIYESTGSRTVVNLELADDVLCLQQAAQPGVELELTDSNGIMSVLQGLHTLAYYPTANRPVPNRTVKAETDADPQCVAVPETPKQVAVSNEPALCQDRDMVFVDRFEDQGAKGVALDIQVDFRLVQLPNMLTGDDVIYDILVTNCGSNDAADVAVRDLFPVNLALPPRLNPGSWECTDKDSCTGVGYIDHFISQLQAGDTKTIRATRPIDSAKPGDTIQVSAGAVSLVPMPDNFPPNNSGAWRFEVEGN